jgi:glycosyltransferase involved in cell wall biosynthesis
MVFSKREVDEVRRAGLETKTFFLKTRTRPFLLTREWMRLRRELSSFKPQIVHAQYGTVTALLTVLARRAPTVVTFHCAELKPEPTISVLREKVGHMCSWLAALRADRIVCVSEELKNILWWCRDRVVVIPSSVDLDRFLPISRREARQLLGWDQQIPIVLFYKGRKPQMKRLDRALATIEIARKTNSPIALEFLDGSTDPDDVPIYLSAADCLLCTSDSEGSPTIVKEAMACNLPIVSVDVGDVRQRLSLVDNCAIRTREPDDLAAALVSVLQSGRRSDGRMHLAEVTNHACRERLLETYRQLLFRTS